METKKGETSYPSSSVLSARGTGLLFLVSLYSLYIYLGRNKSGREAMVVFNTASCKNPWQGSGAWGRRPLAWRPSSCPPPGTLNFIPDQEYLCLSFSITVRTACKQFLAFSVQPDSHRGPNYHEKTRLAAAMCSTLLMLPIYPLLITANRTPTAHHSPGTFSCLLSSISTLNNSHLSLYSSNL